MLVTERKISVSFHEFELIEFTERTSPACKDCTHKKCCREFWVPLTPDETRRLLVDWNGWVPGAAVLTKKENGDCVYLGDDYRCQIYENRPIACREYVCVGDVRVKDMERNRDY